MAQASRTSGSAVASAPDEERIVAPRPGGDVSPDGEASNESGGDERHEPLTALCAESGGGGRLLPLIRAASRPLRRRGRPCRFARASHRLRSYPGRRLPGPLRPAGRAAGKHGFSPSATHGAAIAISSRGFPCFALAMCRPHFSDACAPALPGGGPEAVALAGTPLRAASCASRMSRTSAYAGLVRLH